PVAFIEDRSLNGGDMSSQLTRQPVPNELPQRTKLSPIKLAKSPPNRKQRCADDEARTTMQSIDEFDRCLADRAGATMGLPATAAEPFSSLHTAADLIDAARGDAYVISMPVAFIEDRSLNGGDMSSQLTRQPVPNELPQRTKLSPIKLAKSPPNRKQRCADDEARTTMQSIDEFDRRLADRAGATMGLPATAAEPFSSLHTAADLIDAARGDAYVRDIRRRLSETAEARRERDRRRRRVLTAQLDAHRAAHDRLRDDDAVRRLLRRSVEEMRVAARLMAIRREKEAVVANQLLRERQHGERCERDFDDVLRLEAERLAGLRREQATLAAEQRHLHRSLLADRERERHRRHLDRCEAAVCDVVDVATKVGEYRELTGGAVPPRLLREWKQLFVCGRPLYDDPILPPGEEEEEGTPPAAPRDDDRENLLNTTEFLQYRDLLGDWAPETSVSDADDQSAGSTILGYVAARVLGIVRPSTPPPPAPPMPRCPLKACVVGKTFAGKTTVCERLQRDFNVAVLRVEELVRAAVDAYRLETAPAAAEEEEEKPTDDREDEGKDDGGRGSSDDVGRGTEEGNAGIDPAGSGDPASDVPRISIERASPAEVDVETLSDEARLGGEALRCLDAGRPVDDRILIDVLARAIAAVPETRGWLLDGFPTSLAQAKLLEEALSGYKEKKVLTDEDLIADVPDVDAIRRSVLVKGPLAARKLPAPSSGLHAEVHNVRLGGGGGSPGAADVAACCPAAAEEGLPTMHHRLAAFADAWPRMRAWFDAFGLVRVVDGSREVERGHREAAAVVSAFLAPTQKEVEAEVASRGSATLGKEMAGRQRKAGAGAKGEKRAGGARSRSMSIRERKLDAERSNASVVAAVDTPEAVDEDTVAAATPPPPLRPPTPPPPGAAGWRYADLPLDAEMVGVLAAQWRHLERAYVMSLKAAFGVLREEHERSYRYLHRVRRDFAAFLRRLDAKQAFVEAWQRDYNAVAVDARADVETRAELHRRVDALLEALWDICDGRRAAAAAERERVVTCGWLDDRVGMLANIFTIVVQTELNRFLETLSFVRDYYASMRGATPEVRPGQPPTVAVTEFADTVAAEDSTAATPRQWNCPTLKRTLERGSGVEEVLEEQEKLFMEAYSAARKAVVSLMDAEREKKFARDSAAAAAAAAREGGTPAKEASSSSPARTEEEVAEEECFAALLSEERRFLACADVARARAVAVLRDLQARAAAVYAAMYEGVERRYSAEMASIETLSGVARRAIEGGRPLQAELTLRQDGFFIADDVRLFASPPPAPAPPPREVATAAGFTVAQVAAAASGFAREAPGGAVSARTFMDVLRDLSATTGPRRALPPAWINLPAARLRGLVSLLCADGRAVDWRRFVVEAAAPPAPSLEELLAALAAFRHADSGGRVTRDEYDGVALWFGGPDAAPPPDVFDRASAMKGALFDMFSDGQGALEYLPFLLYLGAAATTAATPRESLRRALSLVAGAPVGTHVAVATLRRLLSLARPRRAADDNDERMFEQLCTELGGATAELGGAAEVPFAGLVEHAYVRRVLGKAPMLTRVDIYAYLAREQDDK
ncbi:PREDICTED: sperm flagellar protein 2-like, partial [Priapulus caudatus]|uniref:Sperm flagellar protein 2-like n=1 Tax=Priapulus caudatus TaxID=37621 RepID=A0ABM1E9H8_PRICU